MTKQNKWISVDDRLPENEQMVLTYRDSFKHGDLYAQALYIEGRGFVQYPLGTVGKQPTHWMYLPPNPPLPKG